MWIAIGHARLVFAVRCPWKDLDVARMFDVDGPNDRQRRNTKNKALDLGGVVAEQA